MSFPILTLITFIPVVGMVAILFLRKGQENAVRYTALAATLIQLVLAIIMLLAFDFTKAGILDATTFQFVEKARWITIPNVSWIGTIKIDYFVGVDGLSILMIFLTAFVSFIATLSSWNITKMVKGYFIMFLLLDTGMMGVFVALDFFLFYVFWEIMLLPMYFLIGIWGGPRKEYAAIKFFIYTLFGSIFILLTMIALYFSATEMVNGVPLHTFNLIELTKATAYSATGILSPQNPNNWRLIAYIFLFVGFAIKIPMFPFHTWLPDAHVEAPTPISVILAGVLLKMGTYGILRISFPIFPEITRELAWYIGLFGVINIIYGGLVALAQKDFKKLIAYSSISHMGYVLLGMATLSVTGITGAIFQMFNHGTITAMLFLIVGVIYDRAHTRGINEFGGLANKMPVYTGFVTIAFFAAIGLPGLSGFISESLVFIGGFGSTVTRTLTIIGLLGILIGAAYMLWTLQRIYFGKFNDKWSFMEDLTPREYLMFIPLSIVVIYLGVQPGTAIDFMNTSVKTFVHFLNTAAF